MEDGDGEVEEKKSRWIFASFGAENNDNVLERR